MGDAGIEPALGTTDHMLQRARPESLGQTRDLVYKYTGVFGGLVVSFTRDPVCMVSPFDFGTKTTQRVQARSGTLLVSC